MRIYVHKFQSTHPHGVRPTAFHLLLVRIGISIHAPTRGATSLLEKDDPDLYISIHAPTRGATFLVYPCSLLRH